MIEVEQRYLWRPDDHPDGPQRGDCLAACIASIFEVPYWDVSHFDGTAQPVYEWTRDHYPGVECVYRMLGAGWKDIERIGDHEVWPTEHREPGFWVASIWSPRIPDRETFGCGCADRTPGGNPECEWCHGKPHERSMGISWGLHAVVMRDNRLVWDPDPDRDPDLKLRFRGAMTWRIANPAQLRWDWS